MWIEYKQTLCLIQALKQEPCAVFKISLSANSSLQPLQHLANAPGTGLIKNVRLFQPVKIPTLKSDGRD